MECVCVCVCIISSLNTPFFFSGGSHISRNFATDIHRARLAQAGIETLRVRQDGSLPNLTLIVGKPSPRRQFDTTNKSSQIYTNLQKNQISN